MSYELFCTFTWEQWNVQLNYVARSLTFLTIENNIYSNSSIKSDRWQHLQFSILKAQFFVDFESSLVKWSKGVNCRVQSGSRVQSFAAEKTAAQTTWASCHAYHMLDPIL